MKRFFPLLLALLFIALPALAENRVHDGAGLFTNDQIQALEQQIAQIGADDQFDVVLVTENSIGAFTTQDYAADFYDYGGFGYGEDSDGILLLLVVGGGVGNRDFFMLTTGRGEEIFNQRVLYDLEDEILPSLRRSDFSSAVSRFVNGVQRRLIDARPKSPAEKAGKKLPLLLILGAATGLIAVLIMKAQMRTVRRKQNASSYIQRNSFQLTQRQDIYLYTTTTRQRIAEPSSGGRSGGGFGGGGFHGSSGTHHGGHGGKF